MIPNNIYQNMRQRNMANVMDAIKIIQSGDTKAAEKMARSICEQRGIDADEMLNGIKKEVKNTKRK